MAARCYHSPPQALLSHLDGGRSRAEGRALLLQLIGRLLSLASTERTEKGGARGGSQLAIRASAWLQAVGWARRGWAWLTTCISEVGARLLSSMRGLDVKDSTGTVIRNPCRRRALAISFSPRLPHACLLPGN